MNSRVFAAALLPALAACGFHDGDATLYRNSPLDLTMRIGLASFNGADGLEYNLDNCEMAARLLNANMDAANKAGGATRNPALGFWCEEGAFRGRGAVPPSFDSEYPTTAEGGLHW